MGYVYVDRHLSEQAKTVGPVGGAVKRGYDLAAATLIVLATFPLMMLTIVALSLTAGGPVFSRDVRIGYRGQRFDCFTFRVTRQRSSGGRERHTSLAVSRPDGSKARADDSSRLGQFLVLSNIDKLPQLFNVLSGEMSLIGPRPLSPADIARYGDRIDLDLYLSARPGMIAASESGGADAPFSELVAIDTSYVRDWRFSTDLRIMMQAITSLADRSA